MVFYSLEGEFNLQSVMRTITFFSLNVTDFFQRLSANLKSKIVKEKRNAFDFTENLQLLSKCNGSSFHIQKLFHFLLAKVFSAQFIYIYFCKRESFFPKFQQNFAEFLEFLFSGKCLPVKVSALKVYISTFHIDTNHLLFFRCTDI